MMSDRPETLDTAALLDAIREIVREELAAAPAPKPWLTEEDVAEITGYSRKTIQRWRKSGEIPMFKPLGNRRYRITRKAFEAWQRRVEREGLPMEAKYPRRF